jgi:hypothetical protein
MNSLVLDLQREALDPRASIAELLRKAIVLAKKLNVREFDGWASNELSGYPADATIPQYRIIRGEIKAWNPYQGWIPVLVEDSELAERLSARANNQGVAELESLQNAGDEKGSLQMPFSKAIEQRLMSGMSLHLVPTLVVPRSAIVRILDTVRNTVLNWSLQLERDGILGEGLSFSADERRIAAGHVYNITHFHGSVSGSQIQQFSNESHQTQSSGPDREALSSFVAQVREAAPTLGLSSDKRQELESDLDTIDSQLKSPNPKKTVVRESLHSVRNIVEEAAGSLVASGILSQLPRMLGW